MNVYNLVLGNTVERGRLVHIPSNHTLDSILGQKWDEHIINVYGDYSFMAQGTAKFWLGKKLPLVENMLKQKLRTVALWFLHFLEVRGTDYNMNKGSNLLFLLTIVTN